MKSKPHFLTPLHSRGLEVLRILKAHQCTYKDLVDKLHIGRRSVQQCLQSLRANGFLIEARVEARRKIFWTTANPSYTPALLNAAEKDALATLLTDANPHVQSAIYKILQINLY